MFEFLWEVGKTLPLKGTQAELDTECLETFKRNTFNILISLPSRDCDLAKFFLLMHFTATSQSRFFKGLKKKAGYTVNIPGNDDDTISDLSQIVKITSLCLPLNTTAKAPWPIRSFLLNSNLPTDSMAHRNINALQSQNRFKKKHVQSDDPAAG